MRLSIRWKLILSIGLPTLAIYAIVLTFNYVRLTQFARERLEAHMTRVAEHYAARFDGQFRSVAQVARSTARFIETHPNLTESELYRLLEQNISQSELIYGAAIAFEPEAFEPGRRLFSPYVHRVGGDLRRMDIGAEGYDYLDEQWQWYARPRATGRAGWSDAYFDEGAGDVLMCTFSVPFFRDGQVRGVATVDIHILELQQRLDIEADPELDEGQYAILSREGAFLSHPDRSMILQQTVFDMAAAANRPDLQRLGEQMTTGQRGAVEVDDLPDSVRALDGPGPYLICFAPIASTGWSFAAAVPAQVVGAPAREALWRSLGLLMFNLFVLIVILLIAAVRITRPIEELAGLVERLGEGDLDVKPARVRSNDEIGQFARAFNRMVDELRDHVDALTRATAAREAVESELRVAREIQQSLLPRSYPAFPHRDEFDLYAVNLPARSVAGDFFDFFFVHDDVLTVVIADVAGKGVPAALFMAVTRTVLRNLAMQGLSPAEILTQTNAILRDDNDRGLFVTLFIGHYNTRTGRLTYANGAHPPPMVVAPDGSVARLGDATGTLVGVFDDAQLIPFEQQEAELGVDSALVLFTDGVPEARSPDGTFYREERFVRWLSDHVGPDMRHYCTASRDEIVAFQHGDPSDDVTILMLRRVK